MAFNINFPYGQCIGGVLDGCVEQDGKLYRKDGTEVDNNNEPVKQPAKIAGKKAADKGVDVPKQPDKEPDTEEEKQLAAQLAA